MNLSKIKQKMFSSYSFIFLLFGGAFFIKSLPGLLDPYFSTGDQAQHIFWVYKFQDSELFLNNYIADFFSFGNFDAPGFIFLFHITKSIIDPLLLSKLLAPILVGVSVIYLYKLVDFLAGRTAASVATVLFICNCLLLDHANLFKDGLPRNFSYPLLLSFLYYVVKRNNAKALLSLVAQSLFYPPIFLSSAAFWSLSCLRKGIFQALRNSKILILGFIISGSIVLYFSVLGSNSLTTFITLDEAKNMAELGPNGRSKFFEDNIFDYVYKESRAGLNLINIELYLWLLLPILFVVRSKTFRVNRIVYDIIISSLMLYLLAHLILFSLYLPSRYVIYSLPIAFNLLIAFNFMPFIEGIKTRYGIDVIHKINANIKILFGLIIGSTFVLAIHQVSVRPDQEKIEIYNFFKKLPKDVLIAGYPYDMNSIPLFSKRNVLISQEHALPYYKDYYSQMRDRTLDFFKAYYSNNALEIIDFCEHYAVDYLLINKGIFEKNFINGRIYYSPFNEYAKQVIEKNKNFFLADSKNYKSVFDTENYSIIQCEAASLRVSK